MDQQEFVNVAIVGTVLTVSVMGVTGLIRSRRRGASLATAARARGWSYQERDQSQMREGQPFDLQGMGLCQHVVKGTVGSSRFIAFEYVAPGTDNSNASGTHGVIVVDLPKSLPVLQVRPGGSVRRLARYGDPGLDVVTLESDDFNSRFTVQGADAKFASDVLSPRLMQTLMDDPVGSWRVWDNTIIGWSNSALTALQILGTVPALQKVIDSIPSFVWDKYALAPPAAAAAVAQTANPATQPAPPAAPPGWYADPTAPTKARWWDGSAWTTARADVRTR